MKYNTAQPYIASYVIIRKEGKIAFVLRTGTDWMNNYYGLPSGKVEKNESFTAGAIREAKEEIDIDVKPADLKPILTVHRRHQDSEEDGKYWVDMYFEADTWQGEPRNAEPRMHSELAWLDPNNLPDNVIPAVVAALEAIEKGDHYLEDGWN